MRNQYAWMARRRVPGYPRNIKRTHTIFDEWLFEADISCREAAELLDIPEQRCRQLHKERQNITHGRRVVPCMITRYAMAAISHKLIPASLTLDCYEMRDRLAEAAMVAGLKPFSVEASVERQAA